MMYLLKKFFKNEEYQNSEKLIRIAYLEGKIDKEHIDFINQNVTGIEISKSVLQIDKSKIDSIKTSLPANDFPKFKVIHYLTGKFVKSNALNEEGRRILSQILTVLHHERSRVNELIDSVSSQIDLGYTIGEAYARLGYLLKPRKVNFN